MTPVEQAKDILRTVGEARDEDIDLGEAALALAALDRPGVGIAKYRDHLSELALDVGGRMGAARPSLEDRCAALNQVILHAHGYAGDTQTYDDIHNANMMYVIDRRLGFPVALGILYIQAARAQGWDVCGLNFPGHFLIRMENNGARAIVDPFNQGRLRDAAELRHLLKVSSGMEAELDPSCYEPVRNRDILVRLQNNLKSRHLKAGNHEDAGRIVDSMLMIAPDMAPLWREAGVIHARQGRLGAAVDALERYAAAAGTESARYEAAALIDRLRRRLN